MRIPKQRMRVAIPLAVVVALACAAAAFAAVSHRNASSTLVVDNSFTLKTTDPQRAFDPTGSIIDRAIYDTLFTYSKGDLAHPIPLLVKSWKATNGAKTFTFQLKKNVHFANDDPLTSADVVFSLKRLVNLKGNPSFLLAGITIKASGKYGVVMTSKTPAGQLPAILANPSTGIVNSKLVKAHGGTAAANASTKDKAENLLNSSSSAGEGSGPYELSSYAPTTQVTLKREHELLGLDEAGLRHGGRAQHGRGDAADQRRPRHARGRDRPGGRPGADVEGQVACQRLAAAVDVGVLAVCEQRLDGVVGDVEQAVAAGGSLRARLQVDPVGRRAGRVSDARDHPVDVPRRSAAKDAVKQDVAKAKAALQASGQASQSVTLEYPSDLTINGVPFTTLAQKVQANLQSIGINVQLSGSPTGTWLTSYRSGKMAFGLSLWGPDYPDPADYLAFAPGQLVGLRAGWAKGTSAAIEKTAASAAVATDRRSGRRSSSSSSSS